jgi:dTMP kinase
MTERRGVFVTFEGGDGSGKTTVLGIIAERLRSAGRDVVTTVEPGGTEIGNQIRRVVLDPANTGLCPMSELLLYFAARAQNLDQIIIPALNRGAIVLGLHRIACRDIWPDLTIVIDVDAATAMARRHATHDVDRIDAETLDFHTRVREEYLALAALEPQRIRVIDGNASIDVVAKRVGQALSPAVAHLL